MTTLFKNKLASGVGTTPTTILTSSGSATTTVVGLSMTNTTGTILLASVQINDTLASTSAYFVQNVVIPPNTTARVINGGERLVLGASNTLIITSNTASSLDVVLSYVEIS